MKKFIALLIMFGFVLVVSPKGAVAAPLVPCPNADVLSLNPQGAAANGVWLERSPNGRFVTDAGMAFDLEQGSLIALDDDQSAQCIQASTAIQVDLIDPFSGAWHRLSLEATQ